MSISSPDFAAACRTLHRKFQHLAADTTWTGVRVLETYGETSLRIMKSVPSPPDASCKAENDDQDFDEEDAEMLRSLAGLHATFEVTYDIIRSPTYQVPVLYISIANATSRLASTDEMHALIVPETLKTPVQHIGPMGALSMTDHPITGLPVYFVHPCRTSEAMSAVCAGREWDPVQYILVWLGLVGGSMGLNVPVELAEAMSCND